MAPKEDNKAIYNEEERRDFLLGFHNRKQEKKLDYLSKRALREKKERVLEKIARRRNLVKREKEHGLLDSDYGKKTTKTASKDMEDDFSKNMFGTDEVTVTVEYNEGDNDVDDEALLNGDDKIKENENEEEELDENEEKILENVKLSENELRRIRGEAGKKPKHKKGKSGSRIKHKGHK